MDVNYLGILQVGSLAVVIGTLLLVAMVRFDLLPTSNGARQRRWLLGTALGTGIAAFAFKLLLIAALARLPNGALRVGNVSPLPSVGFTPDTAASGFRWATPNPGRYDPQNRTGNHHPYRWQALPAHPPEPSDNPASAAKVTLGKRLFFDTRLSRDQDLACNSCHDVEGGSGSDIGAVSRGAGGQYGTRNTPTVWNAAFQAVQFWDGRAESLEAQVLGPLFNPVEMAMPSATLVEQRIRNDKEYRQLFATAFGEDKPVTITRIAQAIAAYERTLVTPDSPYDRFVRGDKQALDEPQLRGMALFQNLGCVICHSGPNFSAASVFSPDPGFRVFPLSPIPEQQTYQLTVDPGAASPDGERGSWRVPSLRNVAITAPYFHNGSVSALDEAVRIMTRAQLGLTGPLVVWSARQRRMERLSATPVSDADIADIVSFLGALTSERLAARLTRRDKDPGTAVSYRSK